MSRTGLWNPCALARPDSPESRLDRFDTSAATRARSPSASRRRRASESVTRYTAWNGSGAVTRVASAGPVAAPPARNNSNTSSSSNSGMRNQTVIDLSKAGLSDENIIMAIDGAERVDFDVTPGALIALSKEGVSKGVIAAMQKRAKR